MAPARCCCAETAGRLTRRLLPGGGRRPRAAAGALLLLGGLLAILAGGGALVAHWYAEESWAGSEEAAQAERQLAAPAPRWIDAPPSPASTRGIATSATMPLATPSGAPPATSSAAPHVEADRLPVPTRTTSVTRARSLIAADAADRAERAASAEPSVPGSHAEAEGRIGASVPPEGTTPEATDAGLPPTPEPTPRAPASSVEIADSAFTFLDPPEPGAQARIVVRVRNRSELPTGPLRITLSRRWLGGWRVVAADPPVLDDTVLDANRRAFDFPGLDGSNGASDEGSLELHLTATDDAVDPPEIAVALAPFETGAPGTNIERAEIGRVQPQTEAPRPRPGPARALEIPRLGLRAAVVPTAWEPPGWVVGQLRESANLSEGNTVLIGHLTGLAGNVFAHLDALEPGDEIIATSRGLEYRFVVSETMTLPADDSVPVQPTDSPRLTLMTCAGEWDPIGVDYSHRLWVVAEPAEIAAATLEEGQPGPLTRQLGLAPPPTILAPPVALGPSSKQIVPDAGEVDVADDADVATDVTGGSDAPGVEIVEPAEGTLVPSRITVRGRRLAVGSDAEQSAPLWLAVKAETEGSHWYLLPSPLPTRPDGRWEASVDLGGGAGVQHTIVVAPVDAATDAALRRQVSQRPGQPLSVLPDAFEGGARVTIERR